MTIQTTPEASWRFYTLSGAALAAALAGCGGGGDSGSSTPTVGPDAIEATAMPAPIAMTSTDAEALARKKPDLDALLRGKEVWTIA